MNSLHMFRKEFQNGWIVDVKHNPDGFGDMYSTNYPYSVMTQHPKYGITLFENFQYPSEVFAYMASLIKE